MPLAVHMSSSPEGIVKSKSFYSIDSKKFTGKVQHYLTPLERKRIRGFKNITLENKFLSDDVSNVREKINKSTKQEKKSNKNSGKKANENGSGTVHLSSSKSGPRESTPKKDGQNFDVSVSKSRKYSWAPSSLGRRFLKANMNFDARKLSIPLIGTMQRDSLKVLNSSMPAMSSHLSPQIKRPCNDSIDSVETSFSGIHCINDTESEGPPDKMRKSDNDSSFSSSENKENDTSPMLSQSLPVLSEMDSKKPQTNVSEGNYFPIFTKVTPKSNSSLMEKLKGSADSTDKDTVSPITPKNLLLRAPGTTKTISIGKNSEDSPKQKQMIIDAGQKRFGATQCSMCGMMYSANHPTDEQYHVIYHKRFLNFIRFTGWKTERIVSSFMNGRILKVLPNDPKHAVRKVEDLLTIVDIDLGFKISQTGLTPSKIAYIFISEDNKITGCLIAEKISRAYRMKPPESKKDSNTSPENTISYTESTTSPAVCGVSRIWTYAPMRRKKIASRLLDALCSSYVLGSKLNVDQVAFSDPTPDGRAFATKYFENPRILVYNYIN